MTPMQRRLYHYFPTVHLPDILDDGSLRPSAAGGGRGERPALWFTSRPTYEPTAVKLVEEGHSVRQMTLQEQARRFGLARITVPGHIAPLTWTDWVAESGVRPVEVKRMRRKARRLGSDIALYRATFDAVPVAACAAVETSADGRSWSAVDIGTVAA